MAVYRCVICGAIWDEEKEGKPLSELDACPVCKQPISKFEKIEDTPAKPETSAVGSDLDYDPAFARQDSGIRYMSEIHEMSVTGHSIHAAMGTQMPMPSWDDILMKGAQLDPAPLNDGDPVVTKTVIGKNAAKPMVLETPVFVSHMSFGALSKEAKTHPLAQVRLLPVRVQGVEAPAEIAAAIGYANYYQLADLLIVGRGGGSIEDLWAFNDERVAQAIYQSQIPVISAVGHEPDVTISDFVADLRAATPSNAAELAVPDQDALRQQLDSMSSAMDNLFMRQLKNARRQLDMLARSPSLTSPDQYILQRKKTLELLKGRVFTAQTHTIHRHKQRFVAATAKLDAMSPLKVLTRGYAMVQNEQNQVIRSVEQIQTGEKLYVSLTDGVLATTVTDIKENG